MSKYKDVTGAVVEHWIVKRLRENKPISMPENLIRISAVDLHTLLEYKNKLLGVKKSIYEQQLEYEEQLKAGVTPE